jgi:hypothetical protein
VGSRIAVLVLAVSSLVVVGCKDDGKPPPVDTPVVVDTASLVDSSCGGTVGYLAACTDNNMCFSCMCQSFGHSMVCTQACDANNPCPAPSNGCTAGFCRP